jgi:membrane protein DedA with SNARE-associated domain
VVSLHGLIDLVASYSLQVVETLGYPGVFLLMVMESMVFPVPSEAVLPPAGWLAYEGTMNFWVALAVATLGTIVGSLLSYAMGLYGVRPFLERYGKYVLVSPHHLDLTHRFFDRRGAAFAVFLSRFVPVVRHLISIPAGSARMPLVPFVVATAVGGGLWNLILLYAGFKLGENWEQVTATVEAYKVPILALALLAVLGVVAFYWLKKRKDRARELGPA